MWSGSREYRGEDQGAVASVLRVRTHSSKEWSFDPGVAGSPSER
jgi:hypothetical protein